MFELPEIILVTERDQDWQILKKLNEEQRKYEREKIVSLLNLAIKTD
jgi:hypothetical protein